MNIDVTQDDIDSGVKHSPRNCPVAIAMSRQTGEVFIACTTFLCGLTKDKIAIAQPPCIDIPDSVATFISSFDSHLHVQPFSFELDYIT